MDPSSADRDPLEILADDFLTRRRRGESPQLREYVEKYPNLADEIRDLFPTLLLPSRISRSPPQPDNRQVGCWDVRQGDSPWRSSITAPPR